MVARGAGVSMLGGVLLQGVLLATYVSLARLAPPEVFGTFAAASLLISVGTLFVESGMTAALVHRRDRIDEAAATAFLSTALGGLGLALVSAALAPVLGVVFGNDEITPIALALAGVHAVNALSVVPNALLQREFAYVRRAGADVVWMTSYGAVAAATLAVGWGVWGLVLATYAAALVRAMLVWILLRRRLALRSASLAMWRELAGYARHVLASEVLRHGGTMAHTIGIGRFLGTQQLGQFNFGNQIAIQSGSPVVTAAGNLLFPAFARIAHEPQRLRVAFGRGLASLAFVTMPLSLGFLAFGRPLLVLLLGQRWEPAGEVLSSLCLVGASLALISIASEVLKASGRPELLPRIHLASALAPLAAVSIGVKLGIVAIGALTSVALACVSVYALSTARKVVGTSLREIAAAVIPPLLVASSITGVFSVVERAVVDAASHGTALGLVLLCLEALAAAAVYLAVMRVVVPGTTRELTTALGHLRSRRRGSRAVA